MRCQVLTLLMLTVQALQNTRNDGDFNPFLETVLEKANLKYHCNEKIFDPILNTTEQHFHTSLNGVFSFSISCFVLEILSFFETCKLGVSDVIYSRIINYIYQMVNISVNSRQKIFKLSMTIAIWWLHTTIPIELLQHERFWNKSFY